MTTLNNINLGSNTLYTNEFDGSYISKARQATEDGRAWTWLSTNQEAKIITIDCSGEWLLRDTALALVAFRDSGSVGELTMNDGTIFNVQLDSINGLPLFNLSQYTAKSRFKLILNFSEVD